MSLRKRILFEIVSVSVEVPKVSILCKAFTRRAYIQKRFVVSMLPSASKAFE